MEVLYERNRDVGGGGGGGSTDRPLPMGALLVEELTIKQQSPFPAFVELMFLHRADQSARSSFIHLLNALKEYNFSSGMNSPPNGSSIFGKCYQRIRHLILRTLQILQQTCCDRYQYEFIAFLALIINKKFLDSKYCASGSEAAAGMTRSKLVPVQGEGGKKLQPLSSRDKMKANILLALIPYLNDKLEYVYKRLKKYDESEKTNALTKSDLAASTTTSLQTSFKSKLKYLFLYTYPFLRTTANGVMFGYRLSYLLGRTWYFDPSLHLLGNVLHRYTPPSSSSSSQLLQKPQHRQQSHDIRNSSMTKTIGNNNISQKTKEKISPTTLAIAGGGAFALLSMKCFWTIRQTILDERMSHIFPISGEVDATSPLPPPSSLSSLCQRIRQYGTFPPPMPPPLTSTVTRQNAGDDTAGGERVRVSREFEQTNRSCPICEDNIIHPTALAPSGYVFCARCILLHIRKYGQCPLTSIPCDETDLVRIRDTTTYSSTS